jgi:hypothetical protein
MITKMKKVIIPEGENDGLAPYTEHVGFKDHNVHVLSLWQKNYWQEHGSSGEFCPHLRLVPEGTKISYRGHGNLWDDIYKEGQAVCTLMTHSRDKCSVGDKLSNGESVTVDLTARLSSTRKKELGVTVDNLVYSCEAGVEIKPEIKPEE